MAASTRTRKKATARPKRLHGAVAEVELPIRAPASRVFAAFTQPRDLAKFWLAKASAPLAKVGDTAEWHFKVPGVKDVVTVVALDPGRHLHLRWSDGTDTTWSFTADGPRRTVVRIEHSGFTGRRNDVIPVIAETVQGFAYVLSDLKVWLERGVRSAIVQDKAALIARHLAQGSAAR